MTDQWHRTKTRSRFKGETLILTVNFRGGRWQGRVNPADSDETEWSVDIPPAASRFDAEMATAKEARAIAAEITHMANEAIRTAKTMPDPLDPGPVAATENVFDIIARMGGAVSFEDGFVRGARLGDVEYETMGAVCSIASWRNFIQWAKVNVPGQWHIGLTHDAGRALWDLLSLETQHVFRTERPDFMPPGWMLSIDGVDFIESRPVTLG